MYVIKDRHLKGQSLTRKSAVCMAVCEPSLVKQALKSILKKTWTTFFNDMHKNKWIPANKLKVHIFIKIKCEPSENRGI